MSYLPSWESTVWAVQEVQTLRRELADTHKKLQEYVDTIVSLHGELRTLRETRGICSMCKRKFSLASLASSQDTKPASNSSSSSFMNQIPTSQGPNSTFLDRRLSKPHVSDLIPSGSGTPTSEVHSSTYISPTFPSTMPQLPCSMLSSRTCIPSPPSVLTTTSNPTITSLSITPKTVPSIPRWYVKRDTDANAVLDLSFVRTFGHKDPVRSVRFSADGKYLASALTNSKWHNNGTVVIYDMETRKETCVLVENASRYSSKARPGIRCMCFSPDGRYIVVGDTEGRITVWDIPNKRKRNVFRGSKNYIESVDISPNGRLVVSASWDGTVRIWNMRDGFARVLSDVDHTFWSVRFSPNGKYVAAGDSDGVLRIWDVRTGRLAKRWTAHKRYVQSVVFTPDGRGLLSGGRDGVVKCWDISSLVQTPPKILEYRCHTVTIYSLAISPDARWLACSSSDNTAILQDTRMPVRRYALIAERIAASSADFSPAGTYLATGSSDGCVALWRYSRT